MKRKLLILGSLLVLAIACGVYLALPGDRLHAAARKQWKREAISLIENKTRDSRWLESEISKLRTELADSKEWCSENLIMATNGDWIVCASRCNKEKPGIHDIFIGRASDGKWYYSTFHFCVDKLVLKNEDPPPSLKAFAQVYFLREFDGKSDDCLNATWPPRAN